MADIETKDATKTDAKSVEGKISKKEPKMVKFEIRGLPTEWHINGGSVVYHAVDGIIEVPAEIASRLEGDADYTLIG